MSRLTEMGVVLYNHKRDVVIGKITRAWVENRRGCAEIEFDSDEQSEIIRQKVESGTLKGVSVGYMVDSWEEVMPGKQSADGLYTGPCSIARRWAPYEISIVSIPADTTVGVGREMEPDNSMYETLLRQLQYNHNFTGGNEMTREQILARQNELLEGARTAGRAMTADEIAEFDSLQRALDAMTNEHPEQTPAAEAEDAQRAIQEERERISEITALARSFDLDPTQAISDGTTVDQYRAHVLDQMMNQRRPVATGVQVGQDEGDKFRAAASDGLLMRAGVSTTAPAAGAQEMRGTSLRDLAIECLSREGKNVNELLRKDSTELFMDLCRQFYNPSAAFPAIMDQTIRKAIVELYNHVPTTFQEFTTKGSLPDFKETADHEYVIGGVGDFLLVPENGEIKADKPRTELLPQRKLDTYAKQFSMTRQAFVNDDIGFLTRVPGLYAQAAKKTIDKQVYGILFNNPAIFDGVTLFHANHNNLIGTGAAPSQATIQAAILQMQKQTDQFGEPIDMTPRTIVVPVGYEFDLAVIFRSTQVTGSSNNDINPLYNYPLNIVQSPVLNALAGANACPWFLVADPSSARGIQVDYLNGQETPTVRRMETPGTLGFTWDIWLDWGISVRDFRGLVKNPGTTL